MFLLLCVVSAVAYALQNSLMASCFRSMDTLWSVAYRGLALGLTMSPLLFLVPAAGLADFPRAAPFIGAAAACAGLGNWCSAHSYRLLPVGISSALSSSFTSVTALIVGPLAFDEHLTAWQVCSLMLLTAAVVALAAVHGRKDRPEGGSMMVGAALAAFAGICFTAGFSLVGAAARLSHPFLAAYSWEFTIGLLGLSLALLRSCSRRCRIERLPLASFRRIMLFSSPTVAGTGCYAYAVTLGPVAIAAAVLTTTVVASAVFAYFFYGEKLSKREWFLVACICAVLVGLNMKQ